MNLPFEKHEAWDYKSYCSINDEKRYEVINGNLIMVPAPGFEHQQFSVNLEFILVQYMRSKSLGKFLDAPIDIILDENNVVQPDILFISKENKGIIQEKGIFGSPDLVIEIISKSSRYRDIFTKKDLYQYFKVKEYWLVDPKSKSIQVLFLNENGKYDLYSEAYLEDEDENPKVISKVIDGLEVDLKDVFRND